MTAVAAAATSRTTAVVAWARGLARGLASRLETLPGAVWIGRALRLAAPLALLGLVLAQTGADPLRRSAEVLTPGPIAAALGLGLLATVAQALRWRAITLALAPGQHLPVRRAVQECYRAVFLNTALPGGLAGDAVRAWRHRHGGQGRDDGPDHQALDHAGRAPDLRRAAGSVALERLTGTVLLFAGAAVAAIGIDRRLAVATGAVALVAAAVAVPGWRRLPGPARRAALGWSVPALGAWVVLIAVVADRLGTTGGQAIVPLGLLVLAGSSIPLGFAGFGPRETAAAVGFAAAGLPAGSGVATAAGFGVLAVISVLPGGLVLLLDAVTARSRGPARGGQVELDTDVVAEHEPAARGAQRVA